MAILFIHQTKVIFQAVLANLFNILFLCQLSEADNTNDIYVMNGVDIRISSFNVSLFTNIYIACYIFFQYGTHRLFKS